MNPKPWLSSKDFRLVRAILTSASKLSFKKVPSGLRAIIPEIKRWEPDQTAWL
jgi:hypothetical protein